LLNGTFLQARGRDLNTSIVDVISGADITTAAGAQAVLDALGASGADDALDQAAREINIDSAPLGLAANSLDPRAAVDSRYRALTDELPGIVAGAVSNKQNLLDPNQSSVNITLQTSGHTITMNAQTGFDAGITQIINAGAALLPSDLSDASGALAKIDEALFNANRTLSFINGDIRSLNVERGVAQAVISAANQSSTTAQPFQATDFAIQFIKKYLIKKDMEANSQNFSLASLITPLGNNPMSSLLSSISSLNGRSLNVLA
jgi:hypothetical protein